MVHWLNPSKAEFPPLSGALQQPNGLLALGGRLNSQFLIAAYRHGCFPWYSEGQPLMWWSPNPRTVLLPEKLHVPRSLKKRMRQSPYHVTYDQAFEQVIAACAEPRANQPRTWITQAIQDAYSDLHRLGYAHSVEVWHDSNLVGGLYGIAMGQLFFGESMFARMSDASKIGFVTLVNDLQASGFVLIDCQMPTEHLHRFGAEEISRERFSDYLKKHLDRDSHMPWRAHEQFKSSAVVPNHT